MNKRYIHSANALGPYRELDKDTLQHLRSSFPTLLSRRLPVSSLMIGHMIKDAVIQEKDEIFYLSSYSSTSNLEKYLESFPSASPYYFQSSIHPGALEMVVVSRKAPLQAIYPLCGSSCLAGQGLLTALCSESSCVHLIGGEEKGTWLTEAGLGSEFAYAYYLCLTYEEENAIGLVSYNSQTLTDEVTEEDALSLHRCVLKQTSTKFKTLSDGVVSVEWFNG